MAQELFTCRYGSRRRSACPEDSQRQQGKRGVEGPSRRGGKEKQQELGRKLPQEFRSKDEQSEKGCLLRHLDHEGATGTLERQLSRVLAL